MEILRASEDYLESMLMMKLKHKKNGYNSLH